MLPDFAKAPVGILVPHLTGCTGDMQVPMPVEHVMLSQDRRQRLLHLRHFDDVVQFRNRCQDPIRQPPRLFGALRIDGTCLGVNGLVQFRGGPNAMKLRQNGWVCSIFWTAASQEF